MSILKDILVGLVVGPLEWWFGKPEPEEEEEHKRKHKGNKDSGSK